MHMWVAADGELLVIRWTLLPGLELVVFRLGGRLDVYYTLGEDERKAVLRANSREEVALCRERWGLAFTHGEA
jgi:hypothetical protein